MLQRGLISDGKAASLTFFSGLTRDASMLVAADSQLLLLLPPQLQQESGSRLPSIVPPVQDVRQGVRVVT